MAASIVIYQRHLGRKYFLLCLILREKDALSLMISDSFSRIRMELFECGDPCNAFRPVSPLIVPESTSEQCDDECHYGLRKDR